MKYSDQIADWLVKLGYTHCFFVGGGNIMHLIESLSLKLDCRPVINEVAAGIAAEYFNESSGGKKALALVTAGPGLTNMVTAIAGAFLESRELLIIGGQAKTADLARGKLRQRGIQEIDGVSIVRSITVQSELIDRVVNYQEFEELIHGANGMRRGPVFLEIPLDIQAKEVAAASPVLTPSRLAQPVPKILSDEVIAAFNAASRPVLLIGGGVSREAALKLKAKLGNLSAPIMTTWNAADRIGSDQGNYAGRPNTWGQRSSNLIIQQSDFLLAVGTRLGLQQTGFNWQQFIPDGKIAQVDIDRAELEKGHPHVEYPLCGDANQFLEYFLAKANAFHQAWLDYAMDIRHHIPLIEAANQTREGYVSPFLFARFLSQQTHQSDVIIPCSSGGAFTTLMQGFEQKTGQTIITNKGLASMGYGLSGAIGAAFANPDKKVILVEGDGGFCQNLQEIGTVAINKLNLKMFIFDDEGYASIRMTQKNYFKGRYVGCDIHTGLGMPEWERLFPAWNVPVVRLRPGYESDPEFISAFSAAGPAAFIVTIDPQQTYFPKIMSKITPTGAMESNPLHLMSPDLDEQDKLKYMKFI